MSYILRTLGALLEYIASEPKNRSVLVGRFLELSQKLVDIVKDSIEGLKIQLEKGVIQPMNIVTATPVHEVNLLRVIKAVRNMTFSIEIK